jgi:ATP-binding protein involved in chromosome partitioning
MTERESNSNPASKLPGNEQQAMIAASLKKIKNTFLVMSGKGGVGKSSVSVNLAIALSHKGYKVGLMDVDIHGPDIPRMLGLTQMIGGNENQKMVPVSYGPNLSVVSIESLLPDKDDAIIWRGPRKNSVIQQFIGDVEWGELDYLIIDSPPGTGDEPLTIAQNIPGAKAIIVTTPQEVSLADVRKSISFCKVVNMEIFGIIENMSGLKCPHCDEMISLFGSGGGENMARSYSLPLLGKIPFDLQMVLCGDNGVTYQENFPNSDVSRTFSEISDGMIKNQLVKKEKTPVEQVIFVIPITDDNLVGHFDHCEQFSMMYVEGERIVRKEIRTPPPLEPGKLPKWLGRLGTNIIITRGMGNQALELFKENGIQVLPGATETTPETLVVDYLNNTLVTDNNNYQH